MEEPGSKVMPTSSSSGLLIPTHHPLPPTCPTKDMTTFLSVFPSLARPHFKPPAVLSLLSPCLLNPPPPPLCSPCTVSSVNTLLAHRQPPPVIAHGFVSWNLLIDQSAPVMCPHIPQDLNLGLMTNRIKGKIIPSCPLIYCLH